MHNIELWPGYTTSIRQHERSILMMTEIKHKLMRTETVLELLNRCYQENRTRYRESFLQQVLGMVVLTRYNNKTYRISDVIFDLTPESTFETRDGPISYIAYYQQVDELSSAIIICIRMLKNEKEITILIIFIRSIHRNIVCESQIRASRC